MAGRFTARRAPAPQPAPVADEPPAPTGGVSWTVFPEPEPAPAAAAPANPAFMITVGKDPAGGGGAVTHTSALPGLDDVFNAAVGRSGV